MSKYCSNPVPAHWRAVRRIFSYLKVNPTLGLYLGGSDEDVLVYGEPDLVKI